MYIKTIRNRFPPTTTTPPPPTPPSKFSRQLHRALAPKPLNRLSSFTIFYKWEAMMNLHILSDPVSDFWKCPKKGFKKSYLWSFLVPNFTARHAPPSPGVTHVGWVAISCSLTMKTTLNVIFISREQLIADVGSVNRWRRTYCTVLYCTVANCPESYHVTTTLAIFLREGSFKKLHPYLGRCPNRGGSDQIPTSLTDLAKWQR